VKVLKENHVDVLVSYLPVGSEEPTSSTPSAASTPGVAFVTRCRCSSHRDPVWAKKFTDAGVPIVGDDINSQVGATITHRVMAKLFEDRGVQLDRTMQLNVGGNMDFLNMLERERLESKKISKTQAVTSNLQREFKTKDVHIGPSDHVGWRDDRKWAYVRLEGRAFGRRASEPGVQARGVGLTELGRRHHRRGARGEDRQGPRHRRPGGGRVCLPDEEPAEAAADDIARTQLEDFIEG